MFWGEACLDVKAPLNISCAIQVWTLVVQGLLHTISPPNSNYKSIFDLCVQHYGFSSMALSYSRISKNIILLIVDYDHKGNVNTPANGS